MAYRRLDVDHIISTIEALEARVRERFPEADLVMVCGELRLAAEGARRCRDELAKPQVLLRLVAVLGVSGLAAALAFIVSSLDLSSGGSDWVGYLQGLEAAVNELVLFGAACFFLFTLDTRLKRKKVLQRLHELRSLAHIIDMHQLTKDPESVSSAGRQTASSPMRELGSFELSRYLDYCSEMLSLTGKVAALFGEEMNDDVILIAVDSVESLTSGLSAKIWQKLVIISDDLRAFQRQSGSPKA